MLLPAIWWRSERHPAPIVEPAMLRVRSFGLAVGGSLLFFAGFGAMLLAGVLFLTGVWHEDVLTAGLMLFPGPAMATAFSVPSARLGARVGYRIPGVLGALLFAAGSLWYITHTGDHPAYASRVPAGDDDRRRRRRPRDPDADRRRRVLAGPRALRHRRGDADDGPPDRRGARRRGARGGARDLGRHARRTSTAPG